MADPLAFIATNHKQKTINYYPSPFHDEPNKLMFLQWIIAGCCIERPEGKQVLDYLTLKLDLGR